MMQHIMSARNIQVTSSSDSNNNKKQ